MTATALPIWLDRTEFPFQPSLMDVGNNQRLSVTDVGTGRVLLFSHGTPTWSYEWRHHLRTFANEYRCIAPDHWASGYRRDQATQITARRHTRSVFRTSFSVWG